MIFRPAAQPLSWALARAAVVAATLGAFGASPAIAAEGAASHYLPGTAGDLGIALPPDPGYLAANLVWVQSGDVGQAVLQGRVNTDVDVDVVLDLVAATCTFDASVLDGRYTIGTVIPFGYARLEAEAAGPLGNPVSFTEDRFELSDIVLIPLQLNWSAGHFHFKLA